MKAASLNLSLESQPHRPECSWLEAAGKWRRSLGPEPSPNSIFSWSQMERKACDSFLNHDIFIAPSVFFFLIYFKLKLTYDVVSFRRMRRDSTCMYPTKPAKGRRSRGPTVSPVSS